MQEDVCVCTVVVETPQPSSVSTCLGAYGAGDQRRLKQPWRPGEASHQPHQRQQQQQQREEEEHLEYDNNHLGGNSRQ